MTASLRHRLGYRLRAFLNDVLMGGLRRLYWTLQGLRIGARTVLPRLAIVWPHQVSLGADCRIEPDITFKFDGPWRPGPSIIIGDRAFLGRNCEFNIQGRILVGDDALVASGCKFIDHDHQLGTDTPIARQPCIGGDIVLGAGVWLGVNVIVLRGVQIGEGAVIGAGAVVKRNIPAWEVWAGVPARKIASRMPGRRKSAP
jgi:acetyltransferase-like isoleucine patch superfamily enzyme